MKGLIRALSLIPLAIIFVACGSGEYNQEIDSVIDYHREDKVYFKQATKEKETRENANVVVYDDGKYITLSFIDPEDQTETRKESYEKIGDSWNRLKDYESETLINKSPVYQEQLGEEI